MELTCNHEDLDRIDDQDVVDLETRVTIIERQESIHRELGAQVVVFSTKELFTHTRPNLGLEVQDGTETEITTLSALVIVGVFDPAAATKGVHAREDIFVEM